MPTIAGSGTFTPAAIGTEYHLLDATAAGDYVLKVDKANMLGGDILELRIYDTVLGGGAAGVLYKYGPYSGAPLTDDRIVISVPVPIDVAVSFTLKQTGGTARAYPWKVLLLP